MMEKERAAFRKQQLTDINWKKNDLLGSNVMQISQANSSYPIGLNVEKEMYLREQKNAQ